MIEALYEATAGDAIVVSDVGQHQMWTAQRYHFARPRRWINSGGLGTMGFGLPAAMGAQVGCPDDTVVCVAGDGSVQMNMQELATCAEEKIPIKVFIMNNGYLGMVRQWQELFWDKRYSQVDMGQYPDFVKLADAYGATGIRLTDKTTLVADMRKALATEGPVVVDVRVTREENTYPMIAPGQAARDMVGVSRHANQTEPGWLAEVTDNGRARYQGDPVPGSAGGGVRSAHRAQAHPLDPGGEQAGRPDQDRRAVRPPRLQHRHAGRRAPPTTTRVSRITLTLDGAVHPIDQVTKQLHKLVNVLKIRDLEPGETLARELALFKVSADGSSRAEVMQICEIFRAKVVDVTKRSVVVEVTGTCDKVDAFEALVRPFGLIEMARTGEIAISRGRSET